MGVTIPCQILWKEKCAKKMVWNYEWLDEVEEYIFADVSLLLTQWEGTLIITRPTEYFIFLVRGDPATILSPFKKQFCKLNKVISRISY